MKKHILLFILMILISGNSVLSQELNPLYLDYDSTLSSSIYIQSTGSNGNQPKMFFHLPNVGTSGDAIFEWDADDSGVNRTIYRFEASSDRILEIKGWQDGNKSDFWFGDDASDKFYISKFGKVGIGTVSPESELSIYSGSSGGTAHAYSKATVEHSDDAMISILTPNDKIGYFGFADNNDTFVAGIQYHHSEDNMYFRVNNHGTNDADLMIKSNGNVGIGTATPGNKLEVNGTIRSKEVIVEATSWPDFVFKTDYNMPSLSFVENYIKEHGHLPNIPSQQEVEENGQSLGETQKLLLQKIEEMTLYIIELNKKIEAQEQEIRKLKQK